MTQQTVYYCGNPTDKDDNIVFIFIASLKKKFPNIRFIHFDPTEEIDPAALKGRFILMDTVVGLKRVEVFDNLSKFSLSPRTSVHDYDLPIDLGILTKLGKIKKLLLIGIPPDKNRIGIILKKVEDILKTL